MRAAKVWFGCLLAALPCTGLPFGSDLAVPPPDAPPPPPGWLAKEGCAVCHPAARKALAYSVHAGLLAHADTKENVCAACHGEQALHAATALDPTFVREPAALVTAAACEACHPGRGLLPAAGAHPWSSQLDRVPEPPSPSPPGAEDAPRQIHQLEDSAVGGFDLAAMARAGYRFVDVSGSRARYDTDLNLDSGFRLTDFELTARGRPGAALDRATLSLTDLADPYMRLRGELAKDGTGTAKGYFAKDAFKYRARGDFHRVDLKTEEWGGDLAVPLTEDTLATASFTRRLQDGFWLTSRIGNRTLTPQMPVTGVSSPRNHDLNLYETALQTQALGPTVRAAVEYRDHSDTDSFSYARPAQGNPDAIESEDFTSHSTLHGPGASLSVHDASDGFDWALSGRVLGLDRRIRGNGLQRGFDIAEFNTTTTAFAEGTSETWIADATATWELGETVSLLGDLRWRDHEEELAIDQIDVTNYPTLNTTSTVLLALDQRTAQRVFEGTVTLQVEPVQSLRLGVGYGFAREWLRVPDLEPADNDYLRGRLADDGVILDGEWRPTERWVLSSRFRNFGQNGTQLHELSDDEVRSIKGKVRYQRDAWSVEVFTENRHKANDISSTRLDSWTSGATASVQAGEASSLWTSYAFTDMESQTLTTFYNTVGIAEPTFVGFDGVTNTVSAGLGTDLTRRVRLDVAGAFTSTDGSFDVQVFDWRADLSAQVCSSADVGIMVRQVDYQEDAAQSAGLDDYGSYLTFLYMRTRSK